VDWWGGVVLYMTKGGELSGRGNVQGKSPLPHGPIYFNTDNNVAVLGRRAGIVVPHTADCLIFFVYFVFISNSTNHKHSTSIQSYALLDDW